MKTHAPPTAVALALFLGLTLQASGAPSTPSAPSASAQSPAPKPAPVESVSAKAALKSIDLVPGVPYYGQIDTEDCEAAALQMALAHEGVHVTQEALLHAERISLLGPVLNKRGEVVRWGDPYTSFVGNPNSASISTHYTDADGYGTYAPNIARVARRFGGEVLWFGTGLTRQRIVGAIEQGHPVIVWVGDRNGRMRYAPLSYWIAPNGRRVPYPAPSSGVYEHTVLVVGMTPKGPYVNDPLNGARNGANINPVVGPGVVSWHSFLAGLATFHGMAVIMK